MQKFGTRKRKRERSRMMYAKGSFHVSWCWIHWLVHPSTTENLEKTRNLLLLLESNRWILVDFPYLLLDAWQRISLLPNYLFVKIVVKLKNKKEEEKKNSIVPGESREGEKALLPFGVVDDDVVDDVFVLITIIDSVGILETERVVRHPKDQLGKTLMSTMAWRCCWWWKSSASWRWKLPFVLCFEAMIIMRTMGTRALLASSRLREEESTRVNKQPRRRDGE